MRDAISAAISVVVLRSGLNQKEFAERIGRNPSMVSRWIAGSFIPSIKSIGKMRKEFPNIIDWDWVIDLYNREDLT